MHTEHVQPTKDGECVIAAAFQVLSTPEDVGTTNKLRHYRDEYLQKNTTSSHLVAKYYEVSEKFSATMIAKRDTEFAHYLVHEKMPAIVDAIAQGNHEFVTTELEKVLAETETRYFQTAHSA